VDRGTVASKITDYSAWDLVNEFYPEQAACLWCEEEPHSLSPENPMSAKAKTIKKALIEALKNGQLTPTQNTDHYNVEFQRKFCKITRVELKAYANKINDVPLFLLTPKEREREGPQADNSKDKQPVVPFPTPPGSTWSDVQIKFIDGHTVSIKIKSKTRVYNFTQMGMVDIRSGNPTKQWKLLESFAEASGTINWEPSRSGHDVANRECAKVS